MTPVCQVLEHFQHARILAQMMGSLHTVFASSNEHEMAGIDSRDAAYTGLASVQM
jgi:hypothetical protein